MSRRTLVVVAAAAVVGAGLWIGVRNAGNGADGGTAPAGRTAWGDPDLSGVWRGEALGARSGQDTFNLAALEALYLPDARARMQKLSAKDDPTLQCAPPAFPRAAMLGRHVQIVQSPSFTFVFTEAYPVARIIPTTGRPHTPAEYLFPTHMGDSTARWEGDTLVVDVLAFNGEGWLAGPLDKPTSASPGIWPMSPATHIVERWRRVDADTLEYQARVEDPEILTMPWDTPAVTLKRQPVDVIDEALCRPEDGPETYMARLGS
jgi:hypothetical protein